MIGKITDINRNEQLENIIKIITESLKKEGYVNIRYSDTGKYGTTSYDQIIVKNETGIEFSIALDRSTASDGYRQAPTNILREFKIDKT